MFFIKDLKLQNFRSHSFLDLQIVNDIVCIVGPNSIGKTSILEALSLITDKKGLKASDASDVIKKNSKEKTIISSIINLENKDFKIDIFFETKYLQVKKNFLLDNNKSPKSMEQLNNCSFIWLTPQMDKIMYEGNSLKRKFFDKMLSNYDHNYKINLNEFKKMSDERIILLKDNKEKKWLDILEEKMTENLWHIYVCRRNIIKELNNILSKNLLNFLQILITIENNYDLEDIDKKNFYYFFTKKFLEKRELDTILKRNSVGPQFDNFILTNRETNLNSDLCSTGEQKKILISLILSFIILNKHKNNHSILLFDEIASHIDGKNLELFFNEIKKIGMQTWFTGTDKKLFQVIENKAFFVELY